MVQKVCPDCNGVFEYMPNPNFPDKRKYCDPCGAKRKAAYEAKQTQSNTVSDSVLPKPVQTQAGAVASGVITTQIQIVRNERANSYEFGKAGDRHKIYYSDIQDLQNQLDSLVTLRIPRDLQSE